MVSCKVRNTPKMKKVLKKVLSRKRRHHTKKVNDMSFIGSRKENNKYVSNYDL